MPSDKKCAGSANPVGAVCPDLRMIRTTKLPMNLLLDITLALLAGVTAVALVNLAFEYAQAEDGYEDEGGYHQGEQSLVFPNGCLEGKVRFAPVVGKQMELAKVPAPADEAIFM